MSHESERPSLSVLDQRRFPTFSRWPRWATVLLVSFAVSFSLLAGVFVWALHDVPWTEISTGTQEPAVVLETADGQPLLTQGPFRAAYASRDQFPSHLVDAVLSIEDRRFYAHRGLDLRGISRAMMRNLFAREVVEGGSTITQQLVKISFLGRDRTIKRKIQEAVIALWLDGKLSKDEILTRYLNTIYLGSGATGIPAAARIYFDKEVGELTLAESAMIAGMIRAPSQLNPLTNAAAARQRAEVVIGAMAATGKLSKAQSAEAKLEIAELELDAPATKSGSWFADWAIQEGRDLAGSFGGTIRVRTTLVPELQALAEKAVRDTLQEYGAKNHASQAALVAMMPDGAVVAMVGGRDYKDSEFNRAVSAMRQPGSTFKLFVYHAAMKAGIPMDSRIVDEPVEIDGWKPENVGGRYYGPVSLAEAFARSLNASAVKLAMDVGIDNVIASARELGIDAELTPTPSLALGTSEVSLLDLTGAYASVRAGVAPIEPYAISEFSVDGERTFRIGPGKRPSASLREEQNDLVGLLHLVVSRGTGREADFGPFAAGKTGTSQDYRDAWFIGFTEPLVAGVWVGNDNNSPMEGVTGGKLPAIIWRRFMEGALASMQPEEVTGAVTVSSDPDSEDAEQEVVVEQEQPQLSCNVRACSRAYRSFRASDCTYQPYRGPRKLCER